MQMAKCYPRYENQVALHATLKGQVGIPQLDINCRWSDNENLMMEDAALEAEKMLKKAGFREYFKLCYSAPTRYCHP